MDNATFKGTEMATSKHHEAADSFAAKVTATYGESVEVKVVHANGGSGYVTVTKVALTASGKKRAKQPYGRPECKVRFSDHAQYHSGSISIDPITQNTSEQALKMVGHLLFGAEVPAHAECVRHPGVPNGYVTNYTPVNKIARDGKKFVKIETTRCDFSFI